MCTVTAFPSTRSLIITMNRDEARSKIEDEPIVVSTSGYLNSWYPVDRESGGTWVGVNNAGIVAVLLNRYQEHNPLASCSRGELVPIALAAKNLNDLKFMAAQLDWHKYAPCDLLVMARYSWINICWDGQSSNFLRHEFSTPFIRTSSSEDIDSAKQWRSDEFYRFLDSYSSEPYAVLDFHLSPCAHNPSLGVNMARPSRHTKSITQIKLSTDQIQARYFAQEALTYGPDTNHWDVTWPICHH